MKSAQSSRGLYVAALLTVATVLAATWYLLLSAGEVRLLASGVAVVVLAIAAVVRPRGMLIVALAGLPLLGFVRRLFDVLAPAPVDPLLAIVPAVTIGLALLAFHANRGTIGKTLAESKMTRVAAGLAVVFVLEVFNPVQGGIVIGLSGALFLLVPLLWYFLGRVYFDEEAVERVLRGTLWIGLICGCYGISQAVFGFNGIDQQWIDDHERLFRSLWIGRFVRPMSTFPSPEEWSRYTMISATVAFGFMSLKVRGRLLAIVTFAVTIASLLMCAVRISVFGLLVSLGVLVVARAPSRGVALARVGILGGALAAFILLVPALTMNEMSASDRALDTFFGHTSRGLRTPLEEESFQARLGLWHQLMLEYVPSHPLGTGLGGSTLGGARLGGEVYIMTESYAITVFVAAGIVGGGLLLFITALTGVKCLHVLRGRASPIDVIVASIVIGVIFTSLTGNSLLLYSVGPLGWALIGYLSTLGRAGIQPGEASGARESIALAVK